MDQYRFEKHSSAGVQLLSETQLRDDLRSHIDAVESTFAMIVLSGSTGHYVQEIGAMYRGIKLF